MKLMVGSSGAATCRCSEVSSMDDGRQCVKGGRGLCVYGLSGTGESGCRGKGGEGAVRAREVGEMRPRL